MCIGPRHDWEDPSDIVNEIADELEQRGSMPVEDVYTLLMTRETLATPEELLEQLVWELKERGLEAYVDEERGEIVVKK